MQVLKPERKIRNEAREGKHPSIVQPTLEAIVGLPSVQDDHFRKEAPFVERAELQLIFGELAYCDMLVYVKGLYLDHGRGLCVVCTSCYDGPRERQEEQVIPVSKIFCYERLVMDDEKSTKK